MIALLAGAGAIGLMVLWAKDVRALERGREPEPGRRPFDLGTRPERPTGDSTSGGNAPAPATDAEALGRVITSEAAGYTIEERRAIAWAVRNRARKRRESIVKLVCSPSCGPCCKGRPFSSARPARAADLELARDVLAAPEGDDPTGGAWAFFEPAEQDRLVAEGHKGYRYDAKALRAKWEREGQRQLFTVGRFEFWA